MTLNDFRLYNFRSRKMLQGCPYSRKNSPMHYHSYKAFAFLKYRLSRLCFWPGCFYFQMAGFSTVSRECKLSDLGQCKQQDTLCSSSARSLNTTQLANGVSPSSTGWELAICEPGFSTETKHQQLWLLFWKSKKSLTRLHLQ